MIYTLLTDGSSDAVLRHVLNWILSHTQAETSISGRYADLSLLRVRPRTLAERIAAAIDLYPCDVLFVHRDAETAEPAERRDEIESALQSIGFQSTHVPVIPVRMTEAWLLFDEAAIRRAAGNPAGSEDLALPDIKALERLPDPKGVLHEALTRASGLNARRAAMFKPHQHIHRVGELIDDFSPLLAVPAFARLAEEIRSLRLT